MSTEDEKTVAVRDIRLSLAEIMQKEGRVVGVVTLFEELCFAACVLGVNSDMHAPDAYRTFTDQWMKVADDLTAERQFDGEVCGASAVIAWTPTVGDA